MKQKNENFLFGMVWGVNQSGYEFVPANAPDNLNRRKYALGLTPQYRLQETIKPRAGKWRKYDPFKEQPALARKFSKIRRTKKQADINAIIKFACEYGLLGLGNPYGMEEESVDDWRQLVSSFSYIFEQIDKGDKKEALYAFNGLQNTIPVNLSIPVEKSARDTVLKVAPTTLAGALWFMLADEISTGSQFQPCRLVGCPEWFPIRTNSKYCSNACRQAAYRKRAHI